MGRRTNVRKVLTKETLCGFIDLYHGTITTLIIKILLDVYLLDYPTSLLVPRSIEFSVKDTSNLSVTLTQSLNRNSQDHETKFHLVLSVLRSYTKGHLGEGVSSVVLKKIKLETKRKQTRQLLQKEETT